MSGAGALPAARGRYARDGGDPAVLAITRPSLGTRRACSACCSCSLSSWFHLDRERDGLLLHGPTGVGKTFFAEAIAGEYRLNFIHVSTRDLVSSLRGGLAQNIDKSFETAMQNLPCVPFFDEFDSVAQRRSGTPGTSRAHGQPAADGAGGAPGGTRVAGRGGLQRDRASRSGRHPSGPLRPPHPYRPSLCPGPPATSGPSSTTDP
jgi:ATPase family associated with various cellular activities (AAA)